MDTRTGRKPQPMKEAPPPVRIDPAVEQVERLKRRMPLTYAAVAAKAREIGDVAYALVRRGARGEAGCFYAFEAGQVVGTPWALELPAGLPDLVARYGMEMAVMWGPIGGSDGAR